jgi:hypothetical protein
MAGRRQQGNDVEEAVDVVGPAVQQDHRGSTRRPRIHVSHVQHARIDLLRRAERPEAAGPLRLRVHGAAHTELRRRDGGHQARQESAAIERDVVGHGFPPRSIIRR